MNQLFPGKQLLYYCLFTTFILRIVLLSGGASGMDSWIYILLLVLGIASLFLIERWRRGAGAYLRQFCFLLSAMLVLMAGACFSPVATDFLNQQIVWPAKINLLKVAVLAFSAATMEEILFRKIIIESLSPRIGAVMAVIVSSAAFWVLHFSILPTLFIAALIYCHMARKFSSLFLVVVLHFLYDLTGNVAQAIVGQPPLPSGLTPDQMLRAANFFAETIVFALFYLMLLGQAAVHAWATRRSAR
ncbi:CPBP family intramembrane glutamic endopeptidase [Massilia eburnea]|nr:CPBP family intramembrane glutamic endopeptidase [Massilia eburnea]